MRHRKRGTALIVSLALFFSLGWISSGQARVPGASSAVIRNWNQQALDTVRVKSAIDAQAARLYAMVNVAIYDAVNGIASRRGIFDRDPALVALDVADGLISREAAERDYRVVLAPNGSLDRARTAQRRTVHAAE